MEFPSQLVKNAVDQLSTLPGVGKRSALRLALHLLKKDKEKVEKFGQSFIDLINNINYCKECFTISDFDLCQVCTNPNRDKGIICVVEDIRTMMAIENTLQYKGVYHVLGGLISPLDGIAPDDLKIEDPYNTYKIFGLPPAPISYVGHKTIELIFEDYKTDYLFYFYNSFENHHIFSLNYKDHLKKLNEYRSKK